MRAFADTDIVVYAQGANGEQTARAVAILEGIPVISTQVVNETVAVLTRKHGFPLQDAYQVATYLLDGCEVVPIGADTVRVYVWRPDISCRIAMH